MNLFGRSSNWLVVAAGSLMACGQAGDVGLAPIVQVSPQLSSQVVLVELAVVAAPSDCSAILSSPLVLQTNLDVVATVSLTAGQTRDFTALKTGSYAVVGEGFDSSGQRIARGCVSVAVGSKREVARATVLLAPL